MDSTPALTEQFTAHVQSHLGQLYAAAMRLTRNPHDAEDLVADTVTRAWTSLDSLQDPSRMGPWLLRIMTNYFISERRRAVLDAEGITNVEIVERNAEIIPLDDASVDVITSNGVLNLVPDKASAIDEIFRVLKPGGRLQLADIALRQPVGAQFRLFPYGYVKQACKIAGMQRPQVWSTGRRARRYRPFPHTTTGRAVTWVTAP